MSMNVSSLVTPVAFSDHGFVPVTFETGDDRITKVTAKPWHLWKLNESLLNDDDVVVGIQAIITQARDQGDVNAIAWEELKEECKMFPVTKRQKKAILKKGKNKRFNAHDSKSN